MLAAARKCRYCGYRFEPPPRASAPSRGGGLLDMFRSPSSPIESVGALIDEWGLDLWPDEIAREDGLCFAEVDGEHGFVLVTSSRLRFIVQARSRRADPDVRIDLELRRLCRATIVRRRLRRVVLLRFAGAKELVVAVETGSPAQLVALLETV